jgi:ankyrin repeat protein
MVKYIQKQLLGHVNCGLLIFTGFMGSMVHGSSRGPGQPPQQVTAEMGNQRVPGDPNGDTYYLSAVRNHNWDEFLLFQDDPGLNRNAQDNAGNTDLMIAIIGNGQDEWDSEDEAVFTLVVENPNREWNIRNNKRRTALYLSVAWGRMPAIEALLQIPEVDPNIPNFDDTPPLIAAIGNELVDVGLRTAMATQLIADPRTNVNQRGLNNITALLAAIGANNNAIALPLIADPRTDLNLPGTAGATPLTFTIEMGNVPLALQLINDHRTDVNQRGTNNLLTLAFAFERVPQLANPICRRALIDYDVAVKRLLREMLLLIVSSLPSHNEGGRLSLDQAQEITYELLNTAFERDADHADAVLNQHPAIDKHQAIAQLPIEVLAALVSLSLDPRINVANYGCPLNLIIDAIRRKIHYLFTKVATKMDLGVFTPKLQQIDAYTQLYDNYLTRQDGPSLQQLLAQVHSIR